MDELIPIENKPEQQPVELKFELLSESIASEIKGMNKMEDVLNDMDKMLFGSEYLGGYKNEELFRVYELALKRKAVSHNFIFKMIDMGLKTSLLNRLFKLDDTVKQEELPGVQPNASKELIEAKDIVKGILDSRFKSGEVEQAVIEDVLSNDEFGSGQEQ